MSGTCEDKLSPPGQWVIFCGNAQDMGEVALVASKNSVLLNIR